MISCCVGMAWSLQPGTDVPVWLLRLLETGVSVSMFVPSVTWLPCLSSSVTLLFDLSPTLPSSLTALRAVICTIWIVSTAVGCATNVDINYVHIDCSSMSSSAERHGTSTAMFASFTAIIIIIATLIIMISYIKVFLIVRRQVRFMPADVPDLLVQ